MVRLHVGRRITHEIAIRLRNTEFFQKFRPNRLCLVSTPHNFSRSLSLSRLSSEEFDVVVIGGGITGAGVVLDAASRGLRACLLERDDFASGTSSKSSKLIHGGLRYLQQGDVRLVYQALRERKRLRSNAPHLVHVLPFMIPILTKNSVVSKKIARALGSAMWMYDLTGGWRIGRLHRRLSADAAFAHLPTMAREKLSSAYMYYDAEADDARLTLAVLRSAADNGAAIANQCRVEGIDSVNIRFVSEKEETARKNGYYSSDLALILTHIKSKKELTINISSCVQDDID